MSQYTIKKEVKLLVLKTYIHFLEDALKWGEIRTVLKKQKNKNRIKGEQCQGIFENTFLIQQILNRRVFQGLVFDNNVIKTVGAVFSNLFFIIAKTISVVLAKIGVYIKPFQVNSRAYSLCRPKMTVSVRIWSKYVPTVSLMLEVETDVHKHILQKQNRLSSRNLKIDIC